MWGDAAGCGRGGRCAALFVEHGLQGFHCRSFLENPSPMHSMLLAYCCGLQNKVRATVRWVAVKNNAAPNLHSVIDERICFRIRTNKEFQHSFYIGLCCFRLIFGIKIFQIFHQWRFFFTTTSKISY